MKRKLRKWLLRLTATVVLIIGLLLVIVLNPILSYANKTTHDSFTIFHTTPFNQSLLPALDNAKELLKTSKFYNPHLSLDICLNDGSVYPRIIKKIQGPAFAWGFYNKVVLGGNARYKENTIELNGYKWNLTQLLSHEMTHCLQFDKLGLWKSKPVANIPNWKWEGYAEYIARQNDDQKDLAKNITRLINTDKNKWAIEFADKTIAPRQYYEYWILVQYCLDIKKLSYQQLLSDKNTEEILREEMMNWYREWNLPTGRQARMTRINPMFTDF